MTVITILLVEVIVSDLTKKTYFYTSGDPVIIKKPGPVFKMEQINAEYNEFVLKAIASHEHLYLVTHFFQEDKPTEVYVEEYTRKHLSTKERQTILDIINL